MIDTVISCEEIIFLLLDQTNRVYLLYLDVMELIKYSTQRGTDTVHSSTLLIIFYIVSTYITTKVAINISTSAFPAFYVSLIYD